MKEPRDIDNIRAAALRVLAQGTVPVAMAAGDAIRLDKSYLMSAKSDAARCCESHFAWNKSTRSACATSASMVTMRRT
eukprot:649426-Prymnesium_polylepis.1